MSVNIESKVYLDDALINIICDVWPALRGRRLQRDYYSNLLAHLRREFTILLRPPQPTKDSDVQHVSGHLVLLKENVCKPLGSILSIMERELGQTQGYDVVRLAEFLTRTWLTVELNISDFSRQLKPEASVKWDDIATLEKVIEDRFQNLISHEKGTLSASKGNLSSLTMKYLIDKYGWAVSWTSNLTEHLTVNTRTKVVKIYEHKICLLHHFEFGQSCPIPRDAIKEALDTLNLLFPPEDRSTQRYLEDEGRPFHLLGSCNREDYRDLAHYRYWYKGLTRLLDVLEEEPPGLKQFVLDEQHRNFRDVTTFWLAVVVVIILTLGFGIVSNVFAAKGYQVALMQYNLALAQACSVSGAKVSLPQYCA
ncbi:hypothetical protein HD806DRAFT_266618 [Xylariaceae sp. AK1471]|nr:hypothetical protein HD806DRAFT_266618 [Xylariaceae sp. AK1471]